MYCMFIIYGDVTQTKSFSVAQIILGDYKDQNGEKISSNTGKVVECS